MSWTDIWLHVVFTTKNRAPFLNTSIRQSVFDHMKVKSNRIESHIDIINGYTDHCHILIRLDKMESVSKIIMLIKGESSYWINKNKLTKSPFAWQDGFWANSVSPSSLLKVRNYIANQEKHHQRKKVDRELVEIFVCEKVKINVVENSL